MSRILSMSQEIFVHLAPKIPEKLSSKWTRFVCVSDTHNTIYQNKYQVPNGDVFRKYLIEVIHKKFFNNFEYCSSCGRYDRCR
jgi:hypothetical protein